LAFLRIYGEVSPTFMLEVLRCQDKLYRGVKSFTVVPCTVPNEGKL
jgi:hypothetical protein